MTLNRLRTAIGMGYTIVYITIYYCYWAFVFLLTFTTAENITVTNSEPTSPFVKSQQVPRFCGTTFCTLNKTVHVAEAKHIVEISGS